MSARKQPKSKKTSVVSKSKNEALLITVKAGATLSKAQTEFNRLMKQLETERAKQLKKRKTLDKALATCMEKVMPLVDESKRRDAEVVLTGHRMMKSTKLNAKDRRSFGDCLSSKAQDLLGDTYGLSDEVITQLKALVAELGPSEQDKALDAIDKAAFEGFCANIVNEAKKVGVDLDLSDLDYDADPLELERIIRERLAALAPEIEKRSAEEKQREPKLSKAQLEQQRKAAEIQEAKTRDLKTLYKQLAKALHPDLEADPVLKVHKEVWMKRLTAAYASMDLRELLQIEMEWLGEESANLAHAGDEKLRTYSMMLKEQIHEIVQQTFQIPYESQYEPLRSFITPFQTRMPNWDQVSREMEELIHQLQCRINDLNNPKLFRESMRRMENQHDMDSDYFDCPF